MHYGWRATCLLVTRTGMCAKPGTAELRCNPGSALVTAWTAATEGIKRQETVTVPPRRRMRATVRAPPPLPPSKPCCGGARGALPPLPPSKPCAEVADPPAAALREVVALPPGLDATSTKRRVNVVAAAPSSMAVDLRPSSVQLVQHSPLHQNLPATHEPIHVNARARMPYYCTALPPGGPVGAPDPRVSVRARNYFTGTAPRGSKAFIPTAPSPSASA